MVVGSFFYSAKTVAHRIWVQGTVCKFKAGKWAMTFRAFGDDLHGQYKHFLRKSQTTGKTPPRLHHKMIDSTAMR